MKYLDEVADRGRDANPFFRMMEIEIVEYGKGTARLSMQVRPDMQNGVGWLQGGVFVALADEAMALALYTVLSEGEGIATISEHTSFFKGIREGSIIADGRVIRKGRRIAFTEGEVLTSDGEVLLSRTSASFAVTRA